MECQRRIKLFFENECIKDLKRIHPSYHKSIMEATLSLGKKPRSEGYIKLKGSVDLLRIRIGPYGIIYNIQDDKLIVLVLEIGDRKDIYENY